ncbi:MAG: hypothetical protein JOY73_10715 [Actinobacteria bacterium]|nr:hypothetical protein [Actinomycetota bacterium]
MSTPEPRDCPRCGAGYETLQEYCLECGDRLPTNRGTVGLLAGAWQRRFPWYPGDWIWPTLLFLAVALVATAVAAATSSSGAGTTIVATDANVAVGPGTGAAAATGQRTLPTAPKPTVTTGPLPKAPGAPSTEARVPPAPAGLTAWPAAGTAYTDVLESVPLASGRTLAVARARAAKAAGLPQAGVLVSSGYPSLHPGYYVVFSGVYGTSRAASAALAAAHGKGFSGAYVARITHE